MITIPVKSVNNDEYFLCIKRERLGLLIPRSLFSLHFTFFNVFLGSDTQEVSHAPMQAFSNPPAISHKNITSLVRSEKGGLYC